MEERFRKMKGIINIFSILLCSFTLFVTVVQAQEKEVLVEVQGVLLDHTLQPLELVTVFGANSKEFTRTDNQGQFTLKVKMSDVVVAIPQGLPRTTMTVTVGKLTSDTIQVSAYAGLDHQGTVSLPYAKRSYDRLTGSVASITGEELSDVPSIFVQEALAGRLAGLTSKVKNSAPESESHAVSLWGNEISEVWIDGAPNTLLETANEIDKIYIGKDLASSAMLGGVGSEGVMMVDTRRGTAGDNRVELQVNTGMKSAAFLPDMMDAVSYANYYNKALANDGMPNAYDADALAAYANGSDPIRYPNVDYYDHFLNDMSRYSKAAADISGGGATARYFAHLGYYKNEGLDAQGAGRDMERFRVKSSLILALGNYGELDLSIGASFIKKNYPDMSTNDMIKTMYQYPSNAVPLVLNDSTFGYSSQYPTNLQVGVAESDYSVNDSRNIFSRMALRLDFNSLLKGLTFDGNVNVSVNNSLTKHYEPIASTAEPIYGKSPSGNDTLVYLTRSINTPDQDYDHNNDYIYRNYFVSGRFNYDRVFNRDHYLTANLINSFTMKNGSEYEQDVRMVNYALRANYAYKMKYVVEASMSRSGSQSLSGDNQFGNFYSAGAAWVLSREDFMKSLDVLTYFKLRANTGKSGVWFGQLGDNKYTYYLADNQYAGGGSHLFGVDGASQSVGSYKRVFTGNSDIQWPTRYVTNIGFDAELFDSKIATSFNLFNQRTEDEVLLPSNIYSLMAAEQSYIPYINYGEKENKGYDFQLAYRDRVGDFRYSIGGNLMYNETIINVGNKINYPEAYRSAIGKPNDVIMGLDADGLFLSDADATAATQAFGRVQQGDIKYKNYDDDNEINEKDNHEIGHENRFFYGVNLVLNYKDFTLGIHGNGAAGGQIIDETSWNKGDKNYLASVAAQTETGKLPRATVLGGSNNYINSTFWLRDAGYFSLSSVNLAYSVPYSITRKIGVENAKVFVAGKNLAVFTPLEDMYAPDTRSGISIYPITKSFELGLEVAF